MQGFEFVARLAVVPVVKGMLGDIALRVYAEHQWHCAFADDLLVLLPCASRRTMSHRSSSFAAESLRTPSKVT